MAALHELSLAEDEYQYKNSEETPFIPDPSGPAATDDDDPRDKYRWPVLVMTFSIVFMIEMAMGISNPAWNALLEQGICSETYPDIAAQLVAGDENQLCKDSAVQGKLAMYRGWSYTLEALPTILLAVPYGSLSDKWGRKYIGFLSVLGILLTTIWYEVVLFFPLPMWMTLLDFVCLFVGGGPLIGVSMLYTMLADVVHVDDMASVLFRFNSVFLVAELVSNPLGGFLLNISPWLSLVVGNICMILAFSGFYFLPETLVVRRWHDAKTGRLPLAHAAREDGGLEKKSRLGSLVDAGQAQLREVWDFLVTNKRIAILILPFVCVSLGRYIQELLLQYATKRYGWSWSKASYFLTLKSASFIIMLTFILPAMSTYCLDKLKMTPLSKDLWLSRWSGVLLIIADLVITFSFTPFVYAVGLIMLASGCGLTPLIRSLLNALVEPHHVGILNTVVGFLETLGMMIAAPIFSWGLQTGIELGGGWIGLPFAAGTVITCISTAITFVYRIPIEVERDIVEEDHVA